MPVLAWRDDHLGAGGVGQRLAVLAEAAVDEDGADLLDRARRRPRSRPARAGRGPQRTSCSWSAVSVITISASRRSSSGAHGEQAGVAGAAAHEGDPLHGTGPAVCSAGRAAAGGGAGRVLLVTIAFLLLRCLVLGVRADQFCCALGEHLGCELLAEPDGVVERTGRRASYGHGAVGRSAPLLGSRVRHRGPLPQLRPARRPGPSSRPRARRAGPARPRRRRGCAGRRGRRGNIGEQVAVRAALHREGALARGREHLERVEHLGGLVDPAEPGQAGPGEHDGVELAGGDLAQPGVHVAAYADQLDARARAPRSGRPGGVRRCRRGSRPGSSPRVSPSRATTTSRGSSRCGTAARAMPSAGAVGRSLSECTATSTSPRSSASRSALTKTPVPPSWASGSLETSPSVRIRTSSVSQPGGGGERVGDQAALGAGEDGGAGADADRRDGSVDAAVLTRPPG